MDSENILQGIHEKGLVVFGEAFDTAGAINSVLGGIVEGIKQTKRTGKDYLTTIILCEPSDNHTSLHLNLFHTDPDTVSQLKRNDIFLCTSSISNPGFKNYHAVNTAPWVAFDGKTLDKKCQGDAVFNMDDALLNDILKLYQTWINRQQEEPATVATEGPLLGTGRRMIMPTFGLRQNSYVDFVAMVVHCQKGKRHDLTDLLLTDYSKNPHPMGSIGQQRQSVDVNLMIQCSLFDENSKNCPVLSFGDFIYVKNAFCKMNKYGTIELTVRHDSNAISERVWTLDESDKLLAGLKQRKYQFESGEKRPHATDIIIHSGNPVKKSRKLTIESVKDTPSQKAAYSFIKDLFNGDFGELHHLNVAVVDYKPKNIADISVKLCQHCGATSDAESTHCRTCNKEIDTLIYRCVLKFRDVKGDNLYAAIYGTEEEPIFDGLPITNLKKDKVVCEKIALILDTLCPPNQDKKPMIDVCVQSHVHEDYLRFVVKKTKLRLCRQ